MIDSIVRLLGSPSSKERGNDIYYFARSISPPTNIFPNDGTIQQLKSSGNLHLIRNNAKTCRQKKRWGTENALIHDVTM